MSVLNPRHAWTSLPVPRPLARLRLLCLPYAGGSSAEYASWAPLLPDHIELVAVHLPGRERRFKEPAHEDMDQLVPELANGIKPFLAEPYAIFGYSMGAWVAFALARELRRRAEPLPSTLIAAAAVPPGAGHGHDYHRADDEQLVDWLTGLGGSEGIPLDEPQLLSLVLPRLRADLTVTATYRPAPEPPLPVPLRVYLGSDDAEAPAELADQWARHTDAGFRARVLPGGHFFLHDRRDELLDHLVHDLEV